jgi:uncharacterized protein (TIGR00266 family)
MPADIIEYQILGNDLQAVMITLDPGEAAVAEAGAFMYMDDGVELATKLSMSESKGGILGKLFEAGKRALTGDSFFITYFYNRSNSRRTVTFAAPYPGHVLPIELADYGGTLMCQKDSFLCAARGVKVDIAFQRRLGAGIFGGEGFILQKLSSDNGQGLAFVHAGGTLIQRDLAPGEVLRVDTGCVVAFTQGVDFDIETVPGIRNKLFGGEGLFYTRLTGPGKVWLQTMPFSRLADRIYAAAPQTGGAGREEGSILGPLGRMIDGR